MAWGSGRHPLTVSQPCPRRGQTRPLRGPPPWAVADAKGTWSRGPPGRGAQRKLEAWRGVGLPGRLRRVLPVCHDSGTFQNGEGLRRPDSGTVRAVGPGQKRPPRGVDRATPGHTVPRMEERGTHGLWTKSVAGKGAGVCRPPCRPSQAGRRRAAAGAAGAVGRGPRCCPRVAEGTGRTSLLQPGLGEGWGTHGPPRRLGQFEGAGPVRRQSEGMACPGPTDLTALLRAASGGWETVFGHLWALLSVPADPGPPGTPRRGFPASGPLPGVGTSLSPQTGKSLLPFVTL